MGSEASYRPLWLIRRETASATPAAGTGRRSPIDHWLDEIGAHPTATWWAERGVAYFSRHYRLRPAAELPGLPRTRIVAGLDEFTVGIFGSDNRAMQLVVAPLATDRRFRAVKDPEIFTAVLRTVPTYAAWLDVLDPTIRVFPMAGAHNTTRRLVVGRVLVATGLHAIGDAVCTTNPALGLGLSFEISGAADLLDTIDQHGEDWTAQALTLDALVADHVVPFYDDQAAIDEAPGSSVVYQAVPAYLAANHQRVEAFRLAWNRHMSVGAPLYAQDPKAQRILAVQQGEDPFKVTTQMRTLWS